jgi:hypothetical protein
METITFKAPVGTKDKLRKLNPNISDLLRQAVENLINSHRPSAHDRAKHLIFHGGGKMSRGKEYLKIYAKVK